MKFVFFFFSISLLLCSCQDQQARAENAALERRIVALETAVKTLANSQSKTDNADLVANNVANQAEVQNCVTALTRSLEVFKQHSINARYPSKEQLDFPDVCISQKVSWLKLTPTQFTFVISSKTGQELARQSQP